MHFGLAPSPRGRHRTTLGAKKGGVLIARKVRALLWKEKGSPRDAICFSLEAAALKALCQVSHSFNNYLLGPNEGQALGILLRTKRQGFFCLHGTHILMKRRQ